MQEKNWDGINMIDEKFSAEGFTKMDELCKERYGLDDIYEDDSPCDILVPRGLTKTYSAGELLRIHKEYVNPFKTGEFTNPGRTIEESRIEIKRKVERNRLRDLYKGKEIPIVFIDDMVVEDSLNPSFINITKEREEFMKLHIDNEVMVQADCKPDVPELFNKLMDRFNRKYNV